MENEVIGNESKFIRLIFSCISSLPLSAHVSRHLGKFSLPKNLSKMFSSILTQVSVLKILSKRKERRNFWKKKKKTLRRDDDDDGLPSRDLSSLHACQINSI
jgi:hypothetical protein